MEKEIQEIPAIPNNPFENEIKVTLNGGKEELESAIVPFTFGFGKEFIQKRPTHVLIIDRTYEEAKREGLWYSASYSTNMGKRYFVDLSKPGDYFIEFFKSGLHNLVFVFYNFENLSKKEIEMRKVILLEKSSYNKKSYEKHIYNYHLFSDADYKIGFYEKNVSIPSEFFSTLPQSGFGKIFFNWVNQWRRDKPVDQCDFRDRALRALTYELIPRIVWFLVRHVLYFIFRFAVAIVGTIFFALVKFLFLIFGLQIKNLTSGFKYIWYDYLLKDEDSDGILKESNINYSYGYKEFSIVKGKTFNSPISLGGALILTSLINGFINSCISLNFYAIGFCLIGIILQLCFILETTNLVIKNRDKKMFQLNYRLDWKTKYDLYTKSSFIAAASILIMEFLYALHCINFFSVLFGTLFSHDGFVAFFTVFSILTTLFIIFKGKKTYSLIQEKTSLLFDKLFAYFDKKMEDKEVTYKEWLEKNYSLEKTPDTITASTLPKAQTTKGRLVQTFKTKFWDTKSKVCKPYES